MSAADAKRGAARAPRYQGYIDERSVDHVAGWLRDLSDPGRRVPFEVVLPPPRGQGEERILHRGIADGVSPVLRAVGVGDGAYAFHVRFARPLSPAMRDALFVRPAGADWHAELAPELRTTLNESVFPLPAVPANGPHAPEAAAEGGVWQGYVDERTTRHVAGWLRDLANPQRRVPYEVIRHTAEGPEVLGWGVADRYTTQLARIGVGDGSHGFYAFFPSPLDAKERDSVEVHPVGAEWHAEHAPEMKTDFQPISHVAMDIVDNCNLRCPFCVVDYSAVRHTNCMSEETFRDAMRLLPYVTEGNFWLSCLHEPSLHPGLVEFIRMVPEVWRNKIMYTTNLAKRMPQEYFDFLAESGVHHINISLESMEAGTYEYFRKGARHRIFLENWRRLCACFDSACRPPKLRYNIMAYRSNLKEIPKLVGLLLEQGLAWQVEVRHTFDEAHIAQQFRDAEYLDTGEWSWLQAELSSQDSRRVLLLAPLGGKGYVRAVSPPLAASARASGHEATAVASAPITPGGRLLPISVPGGRWRQVPRPLNIAMDWTGGMRVYGGEARERDVQPTIVNYLVTNISYVSDVLHFIMAL